MIRKNKWKLIVSSIIVLLPIVFGLLFWKELPEQMTTHWGAGGNADGWSNRPLTVFVLPLVLLGAHWLCILGIFLDSRNKEQNPKVFGLTIWIMPMVSLVINAIVYAVSFEIEISPVAFTNLLMGILFMAIGNYLPKCKQNYTIGIRIKWALEDEENWNATHRFGGKVWVAGGALLFFSIFLPEKSAIAVMFVAIFILVLIPTVYSYAYHKKQVKEGKKITSSIPENKNHKKTSLISLICVTILLIFVAGIMFTGNMEMHYGEKSFTIEADYWSDLTVDYDAIDSMEYREKDDKGIRASGLGSARLLAGAFRNDEFGGYTRYSYVGCTSCVVLNVEGKILVISGNNEESTRAIYESLNAKISR